jgi:hypothetical protein
MAATMVITWSEYALAVVLVTVRVLAGSVEEISRFEYRFAKSDAMNPPIATATTASRRARSRA